jgi:hypothetical protein
MSVKSIGTLDHEVGMCRPCRFGERCRHGISCGFCHHPSHAVFNKHGQGCRSCHRLVDKGICTFGAQCKFCHHADHRPKMARAQAQEEQPFNPEGWEVVPEDAVKGIEVLHSFIFSMMGINDNKHGCTGLWVRKTGETGTRGAGGGQTGSWMFVKNREFVLAWQVEQAARASVKAAEDALDQTRHAEYLTNLGWAEHLLMHVADVTQSREDALNLAAVRMMLARDAWPAPEMALDMASSAVEGFRTFGAPPEQLAQALAIQAEVFFFHGESKSCRGPDSMATLEEALALAGGNHPLRVEIGLRVARVMRVHSGRIPGALTETVQALSAKPSQGLTVQETALLVAAEYHNNFDAGARDLPRARDLLMRVPELAPLWNTAIHRGFKNVPDADRVVIQELLFMLFVFCTLLTKPAPEGSEPLLQGREQLLRVVHLLHTAHVGLALLTYSADPKPSKAHAQAVSQLVHGVDDKPLDGVQKVLDLLTKDKKYIGLISSYGGHGERRSFCKVLGEPFEEAKKGKGKGPVKKGKRCAQHHHL